MQLKYWMFNLLVSILIIQLVVIFLGGILVHILQPHIRNLNDTGFELVYSEENIDEILYIMEFFQTMSWAIPGVFLPDIWKAIAREDWERLRRGYGKDIEGELTPHRVMTVGNIY